MNISTDLVSATMNQAPVPVQPAGQGDSAHPHVEAMEKLGGSLSGNARDALFSGVQQLEESGATMEEIKAYVNSELESNGVNIPQGGSRSGHIVDIHS